MAESVKRIGPPRNEAAAAPTMPSEKLQPLAMTVPAARRGDAVRDRHRGVDAGRTTPLPDRFGVLRRNLRDRVADDVGSADEHDPRRVQPRQLNGRGERHGIASDEEQGAGLAGCRGRPGGRVRGTRGRWRGIRWAIRSGRGHGSPPRRSRSDRCLRSGTRCPSWRSGRIAARTASEMTPKPPTATISWGWSRASSVAVAAGSRLPAVSSTGAPRPAAAEAERASGNVSPDAT